MFRVHAYKAALEMKSLQSSFGLEFLIRLWLPKAGLIVCNFSFMCASAIPSFGFVGWELKVFAHMISDSKLKCKDVSWCDIAYFQPKNHINFCFRTLREIERTIPSSRFQIDYKTSQCHSYFLPVSEDVNKI